MEWCSTLLQCFAEVPEHWSKYGLDIVTADARLLATVLSNTSRKEQRVSHGALIFTWRALRKLFRSSIGEEALTKSIATLTTKQSSPTASNAVFLGAIAGTSARLETIKPIFERQKQEFYTFYIREIVGSRTQLPNHISNALHDFFNTFVTLDELRGKVIPPVEKALLRAPEVVLNDLITPMILALPETMDLSTVLHSNLLKPLLSNVKSTNPVIRAGVLRTFQALASRAYDDTLVGKVADELLNPLKQGKVPAADHKVLHAQMLLALNGSVPLAQKVPVGIVPVCLKEPNEQAAAAELSAMVKHLTFGLEHDVPLDKALTDATIKGLTDKRVPIRRLWALRTSEIWWDLSPEVLSQTEVLAFCQASLPRLVEIFQEVVANPVPSTQNGLVTVGYFVTSLLLSKVRTLDDAKLNAVFKKSDVLSHVLAAQPKLSFLLSPRVYTKLTTEDDIKIAIRALSSVAPSLVKDSASIEAQEAWSQAIIYFIVAQGIPPAAKQAAHQALSKMYTDAPVEITRVLVNGLWSWYKACESEDKDSAAVSAKSGTRSLFTVLNAICLPESRRSTLDAKIASEDLRKQCMLLVVLARPEVLPRSSWIDLCLKVEVDPGQLVRDHLSEFLQLINDTITVSISSTLHHIVTDKSGRVQLPVSSYQQGCLQCLH